MYEFGNAFQNLNSVPSCHLGPGCRRKYLMKQRLLVLQTKWNSSAMN
jgi:hypothetical protein